MKPKKWNWQPARKPVAAPETPQGEENGVPVVSEAAKTEAAQHGATQAAKLIVKGECYGIEFLKRDSWPLELACFVLARSFGHDSPESLQYQISLDVADSILIGELHALRPEDVLKKVEFLPQIKGEHYVKPADFVKWAIEWTAIHGYNVPPEWYVIINTTQAAERTPCPWGEFE